MQLPRFAYQPARFFVRTERARCSALANRSKAEEVFWETQKFCIHGLTFGQTEDAKLETFKTEYDALADATNSVETAYRRFSDNASHDPSGAHSNSEYLFLAARYRHHSKALTAQLTKLEKLFTTHLPVLFDVLVRHDISSRRALTKQLAAGWNLPEATALREATRTRVSELKKKLKESGPTYQDLPEIERLLDSTLRMRATANDLKIRQHDLNRTAEALTSYNDPHALVCAANEAIAELKENFDYSYYAGAQKPLSDAIKIIEQLLPTLEAFKLAVKKHKFESAEKLLPCLKPVYPALKTCSDIVQRHEQAVKDVGELTRKIRSVSRRLGTVLNKWGKTDPTAQGLADAAHLASVFLRLLQNPFEKFPPLEAIRDQMAVLDTIKNAAENANGKDCPLPALQIVEGLGGLPAFAGFMTPE